MTRPKVALYRPENRKSAKNRKNLAEFYIVGVKKRTYPDTAPDARAGSRKKIEKEIFL